MLCCVSLYSLVSRILLSYSLFRQTPCPTSLNTVHFPSHLVDDPFFADTITAGDELAQALTVEQRKTWQVLIENTDMTHNSKKAWSLIKKLSKDPRKADQHVNVTPNQVAHQLILNGKVPNRQRQSKIKRCDQENNNFDDDFTIVELQNSLKHLKYGKAAGLDEILTEEIKKFGPITTQLVLSPTLAQEHTAYQYSGDRHVLLPF